MSFIKRYARFALFVTVFVVATAVLAMMMKIVPALLGGFDIAAVVFVVALIRTFSDDKPEEMRRRSTENEPDQHILSLLGALVFLIVVVAVGFELAESQGRDLTLSAVTLLLAWSFGNILFALHYAHSYYLGDTGGKARGGLEFPGKTPPVYWDFAYYAFVLGMTFQVSDVQITSMRLRRLALLHGLIAFIFNIGVIALTVSLIGNMLH